MLGLLAKKICGLYLKQEKSYQQIKTSQYFPRPLRYWYHMELFVGRLQQSLPFQKFLPFFNKRLGRIQNYLRVHIWIWNF